MKLVVPAREHLPHYVKALQRGWSPTNVDPERHRIRELAEIAEDAERFLANMTDLDDSIGDLEPDGSFLKRFPNIRRFIWDSEFCGVIGFRWAPRTEELPPHFLGNIGYAIVPWKRGRSLASRAVRELLPEARKLGLKYVTLTCDTDNAASRRSVEKAGGVHIGTRAKPGGYPESDSVEWFRIDL